jgi:hypothetical protein
MEVKGIKKEARKAEKEGNMKVKQAKISAIKVESTTPGFKVWNSHDNW